MDIDELIENFELLEDWEDKYRYLIDLGSGLPPLDNKFKKNKHLRHYGQTRRNFRNAGRTQ